MKMTITISFEGESISALADGRTLHFDGAVPLPEVGEHVSNPNAAKDQRISGRLVSRSFTYQPNEVHVVLMLKDNYA